MVGTPVNPFLVTLGQIIYYTVLVYVWVIIIRVLLTWINPNPYSPFMRFLSRMTDPVLNRFRRWVPFTLGGIDFSPLLAIIVVQMVGVLVGQWLMSLGMGLPALVILPLLAMSLISLVNSIAWLLVVVMAIRLIMSLVHPSPYNIIVQIIYGLTEPLLAPLRRFFPPGPRGMDFRPLVFLVTTLLLQYVVLNSLALVAVEWMGQMAGRNVM